MHSAPSVTYPVGRPLFAGLLAAALWTGAAAVAVVWLHEADSPGWRLALAGSVLIAVGCWALASWLRSPRGEVHWDGTSWTTPCGNGSGEIDVTLDLQSVLLARWIASGPGQWIWLERRRCPQRWLELRRAVYSRARPPALPPARPPVATP